MTREAMQTVRAEATPVGALVDVVQSAQRLIVSRIDLLRLEAKDAAGRAARTGALVGVAAFLGMTGWVALSAAVVALLAGPLPLSAALGAVGGAHVVVAAGLVFAAKARERKGPVA